MDIFYYNFKLTNKFKLYIINLFCKKNISIYILIRKKYIINHNKNISQKKFKYTF
jgi:hypothetical protein